jgi:hypothetical protein
LTYATQGRPGDIDVTAMSLDDEAMFPPTCEAWVAQKAAWETTDPTRQHYPGEAG